MSDDWVDELQGLARSRRAGDLSSEEFTRRKAELLGLPEPEPKISLPDSKPEAARPEPGETNQVKRTPYRLGLLARVVMGCHMAHVLLLFFLIVWTYNFEIRGNYNFHYWLATAVVQLVLMATSTVFCYRAWFNSLHFGYFRRFSEPNAGLASVKWLFPLGGNPIWPAPSSKRPELGHAELAGEPPLPQRIEDFLIRKLPTSQEEFDSPWHSVAWGFLVVLFSIFVNNAYLNLHPFGSQRQALLVDDLTFTNYERLGASLKDWLFVLAVLIWSVAGFFTVWRIATAHDQRTDS